MSSDNGARDRPGAGRRNARRRLGLVALYAALVLTCTILALALRVLTTYGLISCGLYGDGDCSCYTVPCDDLSDPDKCLREYLDRQTAAANANAVIDGRSR